MKTYKSKSSPIVITMTLMAFIAIIFVPRVTLMQGDTPSSILGTIGVIFLAGIFFYYYSQSLKEVIVGDEHLILKKMIGSITLNYNQIQKVVSVKNTGVPMTSGAAGYFGFTGNAMDGSISMVKDKSQMVHIITADKKYLISCENREDLIQEINLKKTV